MTKQHEQAEQDKQAEQDEQLITTEMLDWKLDTIVHAEKRKTRAKTGLDQVEAMVEIDFVGITFRQMVAKAFSSYWIAHQDVVRALGQNWIKDNPVISVKATDIQTGRGRIVIATSPEAVIAAGRAQGKTDEEILAEFTSKIGGQDDGLGEEMLADEEALDK